jgi:hypothetical protein
VLLISSPREISSVVLISSLNSLPHHFSLSKNLAARVLVLVLGYPAIAFCRNRRIKKIPPPSHSLLLQIFFTVPRLSPPLNAGNFFDETALNLFIFSVALAQPSLTSSARSSLLLPQLGFELLPPCAIFSCARTSCSPHASPIAARPPCFSPSSARIPTCGASFRF